MGKFRKLIEGLLRGRKFRKSIFDLLVAADGRAVRPLVGALHNHPDASVREVCAEILGERRSSKAIPALIKALRDPCLFVGHDALWAIERVCRFEPGGLCCWLDLDFENPADLHRKVYRWWRANRTIIEQSEEME